MLNYSSHNRTSYHNLLRSLLIVVMGLLNGCQSNVTDKARQTVADFAAGISNLPSTVLPGQFESTAYIDSDFRIPGASIEPDGGHTVIRTYFSTNRSFNLESESANFFGTRRIEEVTFGKSYSILLRAGASFDIEVDSLVNVNIIDAPDAPKTLAHNEIQEREDFTEDVVTWIERSSDSSALLYIHGFNTSFADAANNTAKLGYDLGFPGSLFFFSWPARGDSPSYLADREAMLNSQLALRSMIQDIFTLTPVRDLYIIAEGMGATLVSHTLKNTFRVNPEYRNQIREIVLIAPDIEKTEFRNDLVPFIASDEYPLTLYVSSNNPDLNFAKDFYTRPALESTEESSTLPVTKKPVIPDLAGNSENGVFLAEHVETIEVGNANTSLAAAAGYADTGAILIDIRNLIHFGNRANSRSQLTAQLQTEPIHWAYTPD